MYFHSFFPEQLLYLKIFQTSKSPYSKVVGCYSHFRRGFLFHFRLALICSCGLVAQLRQVRSWNVSSSFCGLTLLHGANQSLHGGK